MACKKFEVYIQKVNGIIRRNQRARRAVRDWLADQPDGCYKVTYTRARKDKSRQQLGAIFGLAIRQIKQFFDDNGWDSSYIIRSDRPTGIGLSAELLKEYLYAVVPIYNDDGERITLSKCTTKQAAEFFDGVRNFAASQWGLHIPEPDPSWQTKQEVNNG